MSEPVASAPAEDSAPLLCHCQSLRQAARRATALYDAIMAPHGLRISQYAVLAQLGRHGPQSVHALAAALILDRTTLGHNLRPLERDGLIASVADATDKRVRRLSITPAGQALLERAGPAWTEAQTAFELRFGRAQSALLQRDLKRLTQSLIVTAGQGEDA
jgi:DNA-binding MarR family transcriptional regulator